MKIWKYSAIVALFETILGTVLVLTAMVKLGNGSGVWIPFLPLIWLALAFRLWLFHKILSLVITPKDWMYVLVTALLPISIMTLLARMPSSLNDFPLTTISLIIVAIFVIRSHNKSGDT